MLDETIKSARKLGLRITSTRKSLFQIFDQSDKPVSVPELTRSLKVNKTTIYREIESLLKNGFLTEVNFGDGIKRYEQSSMSHHHHLICLHCKRVEDVNFEENLDTEEKKIAKINKFKVIKHNLEFFGYCQSCQ